MSQVSEKPKTNVEILRERVRRLLSLLEDPHPGLMTWRESYQSALEAVAEFYTGGKDA